MDLETITMPKHEARKAFLDYRRAVKDRHTAEDDAIMRGYRAMARGQQLVSLRDVIRQGGIDEKGLPRLAVMRADQQWCWVRRERNGSVQFACRTNMDGSHRQGIVRFPAETLPTPANYDWRHWWNHYRSAVPVPPPALRPAHSLSNYHVLWEATWELVPRPAGDPALLKHITGDLYAIVAIWDLTPLEQAVLGARGL